MKNIVKKMMRNTNVTEDRETYELLSHTFKLPALLTQKLLLLPIYVVIVLN